VDTTLDINSKDWSTWKWKHRRLQKTKKASFTSYQHMPYGVGNIVVGTNKIFKDNFLSKVQTKDCLLSNNGFAQEVNIYDSHRHLFILVSVYGFSCCRFGSKYSCRIQICSRPIFYLFGITSMFCTLYLGKEKMSCYKMKHKHKHIKAYRTIPISGQSNLVRRYLWKNLKKSVLRIRIGSGFNRVSGSGSGSGIRNRIPEGKNDPQK